MKVGILSMQRVINYGSFLQAYALKNMLLKAGADSVEFIDIEKGHALKGYSHSGLSYKIKRFKALLRLIVKGRLFQKKRTIAFMKVVEDKIKSEWPLLGLKEYPYRPESLDLAIIGSDEVFHCCQSTPWGFTKQLYGHIPQAKKVVSYAGSFGGTKLNDIKRLDIAETISAELKRLAEISIRDNNSKEIVQNISGRNPYLHIDPVLAYGYKEELQRAEPVELNNYILVYSYPDRINDKKEIEAIISFAKTSGKKLISVMSRYDWCDYAVTPTPLELLSWFKYADFVVSETFHGSIFAIIAHKQFVTIGRGSSLAKLSSMLEPYALQDRLLKSIDALSNIIVKPIDYDHVEKTLMRLRNDSRDYLMLVLSDTI